MAARVSVVPCPRPVERLAPGACLVRSGAWRRWLWRCWSAVAPAWGGPARLGGRAAWRLLDEWLARGVLTVAPRCSSA